MKLLRFTGIIGLTSLCSPLATSLSGQALTVTVTSPEDPSITITLTGDDVADIFDQAVSREDELEAFEGLEIEANLNYLGVDEAILVDVAPDGKSADITIPSTGHTQSFEAESSSALEDEIEDYIKEDGSDEIAKFRKEVNKESPVGITDGSPSSTTAAVSETFYRIASPFGINGSETHGWSISGERSDWSADGLDGKNLAVRINGSFRTGDLSDLRISIPLESRKIGDADIYGGGLHLTLVHKLKQSSVARGWSWNASPLLAIAGRGSENLAAGGLLWSYGLNSSAYYKFNDRQAVALIAQFNDYKGIPLDYEKFELDHDIEQSMFKTGFQWQARLTRDLKLHLGWSTSKFLEDAAIENFDTTRIGLAVPLNKKASLNFGISQTSGGNYKSEAISAGLNW